MNLVNMLDSIVFCLLYAGVTSQDIIAITPGAEPAGTNRGQLGSFPVTGDIFRNFQYFDSDDFFNPGSMLPPFSQLGAPPASPFPNFLMGDLVSQQPSLAISLPQDRNVASSNSQNGQSTVPQSLGSTPSSRPSPSFSRLDSFLWRGFGDGDDEDDFFRPNRMPGRFPSSPDGLASMLGIGSRHLTMPDLLSASSRTSPTEGTSTAGKATENVPNNYRNTEISPSLLRMLFGDEFTPPPPQNFHNMFPPFPGFPPNASLSQMMPGWSGSGHPQNTAAGLFNPLLGMGGPPIFQQPSLRGLPDINFLRATGLGNPLLGGIANYFNGTQGLLNPMMPGLPQFPPVPFPGPTTNFPPGLPFTDPSFMLMGMNTQPFMQQNSANSSSGLSEPNPGRGNEILKSASVTQQGVDNSKLPRAVSEAMARQRRPYTIIDTALLRETTTATPATVVHTGSNAAGLGNNWFWLLV